MASGRTVLLVEDEELVSRYLAQLLEKHGWQVSSARSGVEALAALDAVRFDVVLCDLDLGAGINGIDVLRQMPQRSRGVPFVVLTAHGTIERCKDALRAGAADFIEKPIRPEYLLYTLDHAAGRTATLPEPIPLDVTPGTDRVGDAHVRRALRIIEREFPDPEFSVGLLAQAIDVTPEHLARLFRVHLGRTPLDQIHETRISASERLLENAGLSIYEVATNCGYRTTSELDGWFRRLRRVTPSEWRERLPRRQLTD